MTSIYVYGLPSIFFYTVKLFQNLYKLLRKVYDNILHIMLFMDFLIILIATLDFELSAVQLINCGNVLKKFQHIIYMKSFFKTYSNYTYKYITKN